MSLKLVAVIAVLILILPSLANAVGLSKTKSFTTRAGRQLTITSNINIVSDVSISTMNQYSVGSTLCEGSKFKIQSSGMQGEWIATGGYTDSPPVYFVPDLDEFMTKIGKKLNSIQDARGQELGFVPYDEYVDSFSGVPVYGFNIAAGGFGYHQAFGNLVCEVEPVSSNVEGASLTGEGTYEVTGSGDILVTTTQDVGCVFYLFSVSSLNPTSESRTDYAVKGYLVANAPYSQPQTTSIGSLSLQKTFYLSVPNPSFTFTPILTSNQINEGSNTILNFNVQNNGNLNLNLEDINLNVDSNLIGCTSKELTPGSSSECILSVSPQETGDVTADIEYKYEGCGEKKVETKTVEVGLIEVKPKECDVDADCGSGKTCCAGSCFVKNEGICLDIDGNGVNDWVRK